MMRELLLEIGTEEIPARFVPGALKQLAELAEQILAKARIKSGGLAAYGTPRRLILHGGEVDDRQESFVEEIVGPPSRIAYDAEGQPTKAALGFARNQGIPVEELRLKEVEGKGAYLAAVKQHQGRETRELLESGGLLFKILSSLSFPKMMRWGEGNFLFARPIHWILALYGGEVIHVSVDGIQSSNLSYGHRFTNPGPFEVSGFPSFLKKAEERDIIIDPQRRRSMIQEMISALAREAEGQVPDDPELLDTVTYLVEYPKAICGSFDIRFLQLPPEVLITAMRSHQKYFPIYDHNGQLMAKFIAVCNLKAENYRIIQAGNERVLRARLADAEFFYNEDRKRPLADLVEPLKEVVFQEKLGSLYEKVQRIREIVSRLGNMVSMAHESGEVKEEIAEMADRAAYLCKADLLTEMVKEFPELQGIMGREYASGTGEKPEVARAIYEHYLPRFQDDALPETTSGALLAIADKMDNIIGCFGLGLIPTGSEDPYALRRQAQGIIYIILSKGYRLPLACLVHDVIHVFRDKLTRPPEEVQDEVISFFQQRLNSIFGNQGYSFDVIEAVLATGDDDMIRIRKKIEAVSSFRKEPEFESIMTSFKRVINIIPKGYGAGEVDPSHFQEESERKLYEKFQGVGARIAFRLQQEEYEQVLQDLAGVRSSIDTFFDEILVMADDEKVRRNRLSLLDTIKRIFFQVVDFSKIVAERG